MLQYFIFQKNLDCFCSFLFFLLSNLEINCYKFQIIQSNCSCLQVPPYKLYNYKHLLGSYLLSCIKVILLLLLVYIHQLKSLLSQMGSYLLSCIKFILLLLLVYIHQLKSLLNHLVRVFL